MTKTKFAVALLAGTMLIGCANQDIYSGNVYSGHQAKEVRDINYGQIVSTRPVKIQANSPGILGSFGGGALSGILASNIGGGSGKVLATTAGAVVGAVAGSKIEEKINQVDSLELVIRKDNGKEIVVVQKYDATLIPGARVRIVGNEYTKVNVSVVN